MSKQQVYRLCMNPKYYPKELYDRYNGSLVSKDDLCANVFSAQPITKILCSKGQVYTVPVEPITESQDLQEKQP
jgi:hypothetical protein